MQLTGSHTPCRRLQGPSCCWTLKVSPGVVPRVASPSGIPADKRMKGRLLHFYRFQGGAWQGQHPSI
jgi:hypothetical protein